MIAIKSLNTGTKKMCCNITCKSYDRRIVLSKSFCSCLSRKSLWLRGVCVLGGEEEEEELIDSSFRFLLLSFDTI